MAMMQVEVPTTLTTSPSRTPAPMASQCASKAPTGMGMPALEAELRRPLGREAAGDLVGGGVAAVRAWRARRRAADRRRPGTPPAAARPASRSTSTCGPWRRRCAGPRRGSVMPQSTAATMSQCSSAVAMRSRLAGVVAQPVQQLGEAPLGGVDAAAPGERVEARRGGRRR